MWGLLFSLLFVSQPDTVVPVGTPDTVPPGVEPGVVVLTPGIIHGECLFDSCYVPFYQTGKPLADEAKYIGDSSVMSGIGRDFGNYQLSNNYRYLVAFNQAREIKQIYRAIHSDPSYDEVAEKEKFVQQLEAFRDTASALPVIYGDIQTKYGGDVRAYVDDLFARSALTNHKRMKRLTRSPSLRKLQRDAGFQFAVAKILYLSWELRGRPQDEAYKSFVPNYWRTSEE